jgi:1-acyl-sn-glycerol-3-phosphate acyltransferase
MIQPYTFAQAPSMNSVLEPEAKSSRPIEKSIVQGPFWRNGFHWLINQLYFERITLIHSERLPQNGPVLYLGLHRNGAVDGFVYSQVLGKPVFMISTQLRKNWFARLFFDGIAVTRTKDEGTRDQNGEAMRECLGRLQAGGKLFVFPEGTSSLGPRHLPFKSGGVWLLLDYFDSGGPPLSVVPVGIHYECPWAFRRCVEIMVGKPIATDLPAEASRMERLKIMKRRVRAALEEVGINVPSNEYQENIQCFAYAATLGTSRSYFKSLKTMEHAVPDKIAESWTKLEVELWGKKLWLHQGLPLFPSVPRFVCLLELLVLGPMVLAAAVLNLPALAAAWYAGKKFPDDRNVISLWKILVGVPAFLLWAMAVIAMTLLLGKIWWLLVYAVVTWLGLKFYHRFIRLAVEVHNALRQPALRDGMKAFWQTVQQSLQ